MKILVTGATGVIGRALFRRLVGDGHEVRVLARSKPKASALNGVGEAVIGDITDAQRATIWLNGSLATRGWEHVWTAALALDGTGRLVDTVASNLGHLLGTGLLTAAEESVVELQGWAA